MSPPAPGDRAVVAIELKAGNLLATRAALVVLEELMDRGLMALSLIHISEPTRPY